MAIIDIPREGLIAPEKPTAFVSINYGFNFYVKSLPGEVRYELLGVPLNRGVEPSSEAYRMAVEEHFICRGIAIKKLRRLDSLPDGLVTFMGVETGSSVKLRGLTEYGYGSIMNEAVRPAHPDFKWAITLHNLLMQADQAGLMSSPVGRDSESVRRLLTW